MITLYQFPISHYSEKVRWALDYKQLEYQVINLLPGLHKKTAERLGGKSSLPVVVFKGKAVQNSSTIISYLDEAFPEDPLTPEDNDLLQEALEWERFADEEIGPHVRRICYHVLLEHPEIVIPLFTINGPWYGPIYMKMMFSTLRKKMRHLLKINDESVRASQEQLTKALDKIHTHLMSKKEGQRFLVGDEFTRADIAAASLLAPFCRPPQYGLEWPSQYPEKLQEMIAPYAEKIKWVNDLYKHYRTPRQRVED